jgi:hypothetical protein
VNLLLLLAFSGGSIALLWVAQTLLLRLHGAPRFGLLRLQKAPATVRWAMKALVQGVLLAMLAGYPMALGENPLHYHAARLVPAHPERLLELLVVTTLVLLTGIAAEVAVGWIRLTWRYGRWTTLRKVAECFLRPLPLAFVEEGIFRGIVLDQMLRALPAGRASPTLGIALSAATFAAIHLIRRVKTYWSALGLFAFGCLAGSAYLVGGKTYWLPVGLHAGGILAIQLHRPFVEYRGPTWIIGNRDYPITGLIGIGCILLLAAYVRMRFSAG